MKNKLLRVYSERSLTTPCIRQRAQITTERLQRSKRPATSTLSSSPSKKSRITQTADNSTNTMASKAAPESKTIMHDQPGSRKKSFKSDRSQRRRHGIPLTPRVSDFKVSMLAVSQYHPLQNGEEKETLVMDLLQWGILHNCITTPENYIYRPRPSCGLIGRQHEDRQVAYANRHRHSLPKASCYHAATLVLYSILLRHNLAQTSSLGAKAYQTGKHDSFFTKYTTASPNEFDDESSDSELLAASTPQQR